MEAEIKGWDLIHYPDLMIDIDKMPANKYVELLSAFDKDMSEDTMEFQKKYGLWDPKVYGFLSDDKMKVKIWHLVEELNEIQTAYTNRDLPEFADGILDLVYVALGTLNLMNMPVNELWKDIQLRNMCKVRATKDTMGKRGSTFDVVKPEGFVPPRTKEIIDCFSAPEPSETLQENGKSSD